MTKKSGRSSYPFGLSGGRWAVVVTFGCPLLAISLVALIILSSQSQPHPPPAEPAYTPKISLDKQEAEWGEEVAISGAGWPAQKAVSLLISPTGGGTSRISGSWTTDQQGKFKGTFVVPAAWVGWTTVRVQTANGRYFAVSSLEFVIPSKP
jgi:hypothetical protein